MKILSPRGHGYIDYLVVLGFLAAPQVLELQGTPVAACYAVACVHLVLTVATKAPWGVLRAIPFPLHGIVEFFAAVALMALPWLIGAAGDPAVKHFFIGSGLFVIAVFLITDYRKP
jgi:hypothetical protein